MNNMNSLTNVVLHWIDILAAVDWLSHYDTTWTDDTVKGYKCDLYLDPYLCELNHFLPFLSKNKHFEMRLSHKSEILVIKRCL